MSNATYVLGTVEYVLLELTTVPTGYVSSEWTGKVTLVELGAVFDDDANPSIWSTAVLETVDSRHYAKVLLGSDPVLTVGKYRALVRLTKTVGGTEIPLLDAVGTVTVKDG